MRHAVDGRMSARARRSSPAATETPLPALDCNFSAFANIAEPIRLAHCDPRTASQEEGGSASSPCIEGSAAQDDECGAARRNIPRDRAAGPNAGTAKR